jgi:FixJ family two-component response regulator
MTGLELQSRLAEMTWFLPVILISGQDHNERVRQSALEAGALALLRKPFDEQVLLHAIRCAFRRPRARMTRRA